MYRTSSVFQGLVSATSDSGEKLAEGFPSVGWDSTEPIKWFYSNDQKVNHSDAAKESTEILLQRTYLNRL